MTQHTDSVETAEEIARALSQSIRYSCGKGQYDAQSDCQAAYLDGVETAIAMMYIDLTGGHKSKGVLGRLLSTQAQQVEEAVRETNAKWGKAIEDEVTKCEVPPSFEHLIKRVIATALTPNHQD